MISLRVFLKSASGTYMPLYIRPRALYTLLTPTFIYFETMCNIEESDKMPSTTETQKSTAMDYLSAPRNEGLVKNLMTLIGFTAPEGGRLPAGVKYDTIIALNDVVGNNAEMQSMLATRVFELQAQRRTANPKVSATPESVINAVKAGKISLDELKAQIKLLEG
jgi:hypothetical protein